MFNSTLLKIILSSLCTIVVIVAINFIGNNIMAAEKLDKDAVAISSEAVVPPVAVADETAAEVENTTDNPAPEATKLAEPIISESIMDLIASADVSKGAKISKKCGVCHTFNKGGKNKIGPNLWGIVGKERARREGFKYSKAMKSFAGSWDYKTINSFITNPRKYVSGTKMTFPGLKKARDRAALIAWLREQSDDPVALPTNGKE